MKRVIKLRNFLFALTLLSFGFANTSYGQGTAAPNFDFSYGNTSFWQLWHQTVPNSQSGSSMVWNTWQISSPTQTDNGNSSLTVFNVLSLPATQDPHSTAANPLYTFPTGEGFQHVLKIGATSGSNDGFMVTYDMDVTADNCLMTYYYAIVLESPGHGGYNDPVFQIEVKSLSGSGVELGRVDPCAFFEKQSNPTAMAGGGWFTNAGWAYSQWQNVAINLIDYIGGKVRVCVRLSDCAWSGHGGYMFFVGRARPAKITTNVCSTGDTIAVLVAPNGFQKYEWYYNTGSNAPEYAIADGSAVFIPTDGTNGNDTLIIRQNNVNTYLGADGEGEIFVCLTSATTGSVWNGTPVPACKGYISTTIKDEKPVLHFTFDNPDHNLNIHFHNNTEEGAHNNPDVYKWDFTSDGIWDVTWNNTLDTAGLRSPQYVFPACGNYDVTLRAEKLQTNGNICGQEMKLSINIPCIDLSFDSILICIGDTTVLVASNPTGNVLTPGYTWADLQGNDLAPINISGRPDWFKKGYMDSLTVIATISQPGNPIKMNDTAFINVQYFPELLIDGDTVICIGENSTVWITDTTHTIVNFQLVGERPPQYGATLTNPVPSPVLQITSPPNDTVVYILGETAIGCVVWDSITVKVVNPDVSEDTTICPGEPVELWGYKAYAYHWEYTDTNGTVVDLGTNQNITVNPLTTTTYKMTGYGPSNRPTPCNTDKFVTVHVDPIPVPTINYTPNYVDASNPVLSITDNSPYGVSTQWEFSDGFTSTDRNLNHSFTDAGNDSVWIQLVSYNSLGCSDSTKIFIPVEIFAVYIPSAFTPDGDGINDRFFFITLNKLEDVTFNVYNRWGGIVFSYTSDVLDPDVYNKDKDVMLEALGWDAKNVTSGTYIYRLQYKNKESKRIIDKSGTINVIK
ncbi:MAG: gliding motility-associated C-terminal domain-containing protein [Bacteroidales bacterium]|jgi:hypothetical protein|nr:gliding motility-associated C-terminal domain-containing protein [Bacteroidales bacterium]